MTGSPEQTIARLEDELRQAPERFASLQLAGGGAVEVLWQGGDAADQDEARAAIDRVRRTPTRRVEVRDAVYRLAQMQQQRRAIRPDPLFADSGIGVLALEPNGFRLVVGGDDAGARRLLSVRSSSVGLHFDNRAMPRPAGQ